ncbi:FACT complex subunit [Arthrobotrys conoides]|uniref:FACT complex subunit POB3 n=1 Tax=Arthrobotrys conoides TaxID=74498 RepID=A0AAN8NGL8_9PEZI
MPDQETFENIYKDLSKESGRCRFAKGGMGWKPAGGSTWTLNSNEFQGATCHWSRAARGYECKIYLKLKNEIMQLDGFEQSDFDRLKEILKHSYNAVLENREHSLKGWNWGKAEFHKKELFFNVNNKPAFEIPFDEISNSNLAGKAEVAIEFADKSDLEANASGKKNKKVFAGVDQLMEMRFYIPGMPEKGDGDDEDNESKAGSEDEADDDGEGKKKKEARTAAEVFYDTLVTKADIGDVAGDSFAIFPSILFLTPRGRYDVDMYEASFRLRGKTYDYKIPYENVKKFFLLPKPGDMHHLLVLGLEPALQQGQTKYPFLVLQFQQDEELTCDLNISEADLESKFQNRLQMHYENSAHLVLSSIFKGVTGKKMTTPSKDFTSYNQQYGVKCSLKANEGNLFFLDKALLFVPKPAIYVSFDHVQFVTLSRLGGQVSASRTFDVTVKMSSGSEHQFNNINREEQASLENFFKARGVKIKNDLVEDVRTSLLRTALDDEMGDDDDMEVSRVDRGSADEDDESVDEDFEAESESDVAEEYDSNHESSGSGSEDEAGGANDDDDDDDDMEVDEESEEEDQRPAKKKAKTTK